MLLAAAHTRFSQPQASDRLPHAGLSDKFSRSSVFSETFPVPQYVPSLVLTAVTSGIVALSTVLEAEIVSHDPLLRSVWLVGSYQLFSESLPNRTIAICVTGQVVDCLAGAFIVGKFDEQRNSNELIVRFSIPWM